MVNYGIQMYSLRDMTEHDLEGALRIVSALGYHAVEFAGFFGHSAEEVAAMLDRYHLVISSTHTNWRELTPDHLAETIRYHKTIGNPNIILPAAISAPQKRWMPSSTCSTMCSPSWPLRVSRWGITTMPTNSCPTAGES